MTKIRVNLVGAGRVGQTLLGLLRLLPEYSVQDVLSRRLTSAQDAIQFAGTGRAVERYTELRSADLWILAVPDSQISITATEIADVFKGRDVGDPPPVAFHCSGFFAADQMTPLNRLGWRLASVHPVLTFTDPATASQQFVGTFCGIEGEEPALVSIEQLLRRLGAIPFHIKSENKSLYHAAAVISNNFTVVLQAIAREVWAAAGVPDDIAKQLNTTLLKATYENVAAFGPLGALTGPAFRGDDAVVRQQAEDVTRWDPAAGTLYKELSSLATNMKVQGKIR